MPRARGLAVMMFLLASSWASAGEEAPVAPPAAQESPTALRPAGQESPELPQPTDRELPGVPPAISEPAPPPVVIEPTGPPDTDLQPETEVTIDKGTPVAVGIGFGGPIGATASVRILHGLAADVREPDGRVKAVCALPIPHCAQGFLLEVEAGSGGGKLSLGVGARARVDEEDFHGTVGVGLGVSLARTWGSPIGAEPGLFYLGPEIDLSILHVDLTLGVLWRVSGRAGASALFSWGVGFGL